MDTALWQEIIGYTRHGTPVYRIAGAEGEGGDGGNGEGGSGDGGGRGDPQGGQGGDGGSPPPGGSGGQGGDGGGSGEGGGGKGDPPDRTFNQDDVDRIVRDRLARERKQYADYEDLKTKAAEFDKLQDAQKTEIERAAEARAAAEREAEQARADLQEERTRNAVFTEASKLKIADLEAAYKLLDSSRIEYDDDGHPKAETVKAALEELVKERSYLTAPSRPQGSADGGARGDAAPKASIDDWLRRSTGHAR